MKSFCTQCEVHFATHDALCRLCFEKMSAREMKYTLGKVNVVQGQRPFSRPFLKKEPIEVKQEEKQL